MFYTSLILPSKAGVSNSRPAGQLRPAGRYFVAPTFIWKFNVSAAREFCIVATPLLAAVWDNVMMFWFPTVPVQWMQHACEWHGGRGRVRGRVCVCVCVWVRERAEREKSGFGCAESRRVKIIVFRPLSRRSWCIQCFICKSQGAGTLSTYDSAGTTSTGPGTHIKRRLKQHTHATYNAVGLI